MTLVNYALTTSAKVKLSLGITDSSKDALIEQTINGVSGYIQRFCGRKFLSQSYAEIREGQGKTKLFLDERPVTVLTKVESRSGTPSAPVWITYNPDSYLLYNEEGYIAFYGNLSNVNQGYKVTYTAGYLIDFTNEFNASLHTLPMELTQICTDIVAQMINTSSSQGISSESTEGQSITFNMDPKAISSSQKSVLNTFKAYRI